MNGWYALVAALAGWLVAQIWKTIAGLLSKSRPRKMSFGAFIGYATRSGGMPSGHSAAMSALTTCIGMTAGFDSELFALALAVTLVIVYDAIHVRYAVGVQGQALNKLLEKSGQKPLPIVEGHTLPQAVVGVMIGIITGVIAGVLFKA